MLEMLLGSIVMQLDAEPAEKDVAGLLGSTKRALLLMNLGEELARHLDTKRFSMMYHVMLNGTS
jgi:hypothetical protein